jgi:polyketide biosynthesis enoyl-CoA hydratase PksH
VGGVMDRALNAHFENGVCFLQLDDPATHNAISAELIRDCEAALDQYAQQARVVVFSGSPEVFCSGADFHSVRASFGRGRLETSDPEPLYALWSRLTRDPYVVVSHVRGRVNAGGMGFLGASDIVIADSGAQFSLSEMLFGLFPACVLPFLIRRIGRQRAHYMTLMTQAFSAQQACAFGLVDVHDARSEDVLRRHLLRLRKLSRNAIGRYKAYMQTLDDLPDRAQTAAIAANRAIFSDAEVLRGIARYVDEGTFPWEQ